MSKITLRQIRYFAVLSKALQFRRAAEQLGISQPSLSLQIDALESLLGAKLVERRRSGLILTVVGRDVAKLAEKILGDVDALEHIVGPSQSDLGGTLRLGASPTIGPYLLPRVLSDLHQKYPDLKLVIRDAPPRLLQEDLIAGRYDLILTELPVTSGGVKVTELYREPLMLALPQQHKLVGHDKLRHGELAGETMISLNPDYGLYRRVSDLCETAGATLRDEFEGTSLDALRQMVSLEMGLTLLPSLYVKSEVTEAKADVSIIPLRPQLYRQVGLVWRSSSGTPKSFETFGEIVREVARKELGSTAKGV